MKDPCPVCENKAYLSSMEMTPELVAEMAAAEESKGLQRRTL